MWPGFEYVCLSVCLSPCTHPSVTSNRIHNKFPAVSTTKIDATVSKLTVTQDGTEQQLEEWDGQCMWHVFVWKEIWPVTTCAYTRSIKWVWEEYRVFTWTGFSRLRIGTCSGPCWREWWTLGLHKMWGMVWLTEEIFGSWDTLWHVELVGDIYK
jgi:hypothetical protein